MKKIIFGLIFTVSFAGGALANGNVVKPENKSIKKVFNCTIQTRVYYKDSSGNSLGYKDYCTEGSGSQCDGAVNGIVTKSKEVKITGISNDIN